MHGAAVCDDCFGPDQEVSGFCDEVLRSYPCFRSLTDHERRVLDERLGHGDQLEALR